jgi:uncharacterized protein (DUF1778 family)
MANVAEERGRITARVPLVVQEKLQEAADLTGATLNQFVVQCALERAEEIIDREKVIAITREDAAMLIELLENPPKPNAAFKRALDRYKGRIRDGSLHNKAGSEP